MRELGSLGARLRKFVVVGKLQKKGAFQELVSGAPHLEEVSMRVDEDLSGTPIEGCIANAVEAFVKCTNLRYLEITADDGPNTRLLTVETAYYQLRLCRERRVHISVFGIDYVS